MSAQLAAEQAILGALLIGHDWHTASVLSADDFQAESERLIYAAIGRCGLRAIACPFRLEALPASFAAGSQGFV